MVVSYNQWQTRKRAWDNEWKITEGGPSTEALKLLDKLPIWFDSNKDWLTQTHLKLEEPKLSILSLSLLRLHVLIGTGLNKPRNPTHRSTLQSPNKPFMSQAGKASIAHRSHRYLYVLLGRSELRFRRGC